MDRNRERSRMVMDTVSELTRKGVGNEISSMARTDLEYGIDRETVEEYACSGRDTELLRKYSWILKQTPDRRFTGFLWEGNYNAEQMAILFEFYQKGIPLEKLAELMGKDMTEDALRGALSAIQDGMFAAERDPEQGSATEFAELREQMKELAENITKNQKFYESVSEQLKQIGAAGADAEKVREELSAEIDQKDKMLGDQQDNLNKVHAQMAALRSEKAALEKKVEELKEKEGNAGKYEAEAAKLRETKEGLETELKEAREEAASVSLELSGVKAERDLKAAELEREKAETSRLNGELEKIREELEQAKTAAVNERTADAGAGYRGANNLQPEDKPGNLAENSIKAVSGEQRKMEQPVSYGGVSDRPDRMPEMAGKKEGMTMQDYHTAVRLGGSEIPVTVDHTKAPERDGFLSALGKKLFGDRKRMRIIKAVAAAGLDKDQMKQVANAVRSGLLENEVIDIINSGFDAEEMEQAVEIVLAEKSY